MRQRGPRAIRGIRGRAAPRGGAPEAVAVLVDSARARVRSRPRSVDADVLGDPRRALRRAVEIAARDRNPDRGGDHVDLVLTGLGEDVVDELVERGVEVDAGGAIDRPHLVRIRVAGPTLRLDLVL